MSIQTDLAIVGSGPAGLAAACAARDCGLEVTLVDEQAQVGGQLFRAIGTPLGLSALAKTEQEQGLRLVEAFHTSGATYVPETTVWGLEGRTLYTVSQGKGAQIDAAAVIVATGGMERPVPFEGWTLPGVMGAGGADILLRSGGKLTQNADAPVILVGNGPLLLLLAGHLLDAGVRISAWLDTGQWSRRLQAGAVLPQAMLDLPYLGKGLALAWKVIKGRIPLITNASNIRAMGEGRLEKVLFSAGGREYEMPAGLLLRHEGIIPRTHILQSVHAAHAWDKVQRYWFPVLDGDGASSVENIYMAGDGGYVHGGDASICKGTLAGLAVARKLKVISQAEATRRGAKARSSLQRMRWARAFLRYVFAPDPRIFAVSDNTLVCRCECVTAGLIRQAVAEGHTEVNEVKRFTRCGMGQCQGRMCGPALAEITAAAQGKSPDAVGCLHIRAPFRPVSLEKYCSAALAMPINV